MNTPPPLHPPRPAASFVTVLAWIGIALGLLGVAYGLLQGLLSLLLPADYYLRMLNPYGGPAPTLPQPFQWIYTHMAAASLLSTTLSAVFLAVSWGLLKRREWGRRGFIALLVLGTLSQLGSLALLPRLVDFMLAVQGSALLPGQTLPPEFVAFMRVFMLAFGALFLVFAGFHAWIVWKLCRPRIRAEFAPLA